MRDLRLVLKPRLVTHLPGWATVVVLVVCSAVAAYKTHDASRLLADATAKREVAEVERGKLARAVVRLSPEQTRHWHTLSAEIAYPWNGFFHAVERTANADIELLEMTPDKTRRQMTLRGEARNNTALVAYVQNLASQSNLRDVFVSRIRNIERGNLLTVEFEIRMSVI